MNLSQFNHDLDESTWFSSRLDKYYYPKFISRLNAECPDNDFSIKRITSTDKQHIGIDLIISDSKTSKKYFVDEKAQLTYLNKTLPTFVFELHYLNRHGYPRTGWFLDSEKQTTVYFLFRHIMSPRDGHIESFRMDSIGVNKLNTYLSKHGLDLDFLQKTVDNFNQASTLEDNLFVIKEGKKYGFKKLTNKSNLNKIITLTRSPHLNEKPINLLIDLEKLIAINPTLFTQYIYTFQDTINKVSTST